MDILSKPEVSHDAYEVAWARSALRNLERLPDKVSTVCVEFVYGALAENPRRVGRGLRLELLGKRSARRGDFRVIDEIDDEQRVVTVIAIDQRSDVYRPR